MTTSTDHPTPSGFSCLVVTLSRLVFAGAIIVQMGTLLPVDATLVLLSAGWIIIWMPIFLWRRSRESVGVWSRCSMLT